MNVSRPRSGQRPRRSATTGAVVGGLVPPALTYLAVERQMAFAVPMLIGKAGGLVSFVITLFFSPETKGSR